MNALAAPLSDRLSWDMKIPLWGFASVLGLQLVTFAFFMGALAQRVTSLEGDQGRGPAMIERVSKVEEQLKGVAAGVERIERRLDK